MNRHLGHFLLKFHACFQQKTYIISKIRNCSHLSLKTNAFQYVHITRFLRILNNVIPSMWLDIIISLLCQYYFCFAFLLLLLILMLGAFCYVYMLMFFMWVMINKRKQIKISKQLPRLFNAILKINRKILTAPQIC